RSGGGTPLAATGRRAEMAAGGLDPQGPAAESMADLWWLMLGLGVAVFVVFAVVLAVGLFRRRPPEAAEPGSVQQNRFRGWMVGGGVAVPLIVIAVVFAATVHAMRDIPTAAPAGALVIEVVGHQWWWEVRYPEERITTANEVHIPVGRSVALRLTSADVIHSFWVPELGGKMDMLPDKTNTLVLEADEPGEHVSRCAEFCGLQHTLMGMVVVAEPADRFNSWVAARRQPATEPGEATARRGAEVFLGAGGCASCHAVRGTAAVGTVGPDLTHFASRPTLGAAPVRNTPDNRAAWVADPHALKRGVAMPATQLGADDLDAVLAYLGSLR
ncbi:MAG TPA: cytochrome c oxidase subunit II, partial [Acidimicrobiales bacterium]|nr:cytochrome c oxidase subunit II [Acidimicrobiales bacterium]